LRALIRRMSIENPLWGAPRIHGELLKLGLAVAQSSVAKYMVKRRGPPGQGWCTFLHNHAPDIAAMDLFVVPTIGFKLLYGFVIVRLNRRDLVWINVTANPNAEWVARQITEAFPWNEAPRYMIRDRDQIYGAVVTRRLRAMGIRDKPIAPASPWQNGFAERLIGSIRHECLDHFIIRGEVHLRRILRSYAMYYNKIRTHRSLDKDATYGPAARSLDHHLARIVSSRSIVSSCSSTRLIVSSTSGISTFSRALARRSVRRYSRARRCKLAARAPISVASRSSRRNAARQDSASGDGSIAAGISEGGSAGHVTSKSGTARNTDRLGWGSAEGLGGTG
jgi:transposase InsO family protein